MNKRQEAIYNLYGENFYKKDEMIELESKEKILGWFFSDNTFPNKEILLKEMSITEIEMEYDKAHNGASHF